MVKVHGSKLKKLHIKNMLKTLKTLTLEAMMTYLFERDKQVYITIDWVALDALGGKLEADRTKFEHGITLDIGMSAVRNFEVSENMMTFNTKFNGIDQLCFIPTASVAALFDRESGQGFQYNVTHDVQVEQSETEIVKPALIPKPKEAKKPSFLSVVK